MSSLKRTLLVAAPAPASMRNLVLLGCVVSAGGLLLLVIAARQRRMNRLDARLLVLQALLAGKQLSPMTTLVLRDTEDDVLRLGPQHRRPLILLLKEHSSLMLLVLPAPHLLAAGDTFDVVNARNAPVFVTGTNEYKYDEPTGIGLHRTTYIHVGRPAMAAIVAVPAGAMVRLSLSASREESGASFFWQASGPALHLLDTKHSVLVTDPTLRNDDAGMSYERRLPGLLARVGGRSGTS